MGVILHAKMKGDNKIVYEVQLDYPESLQLQGHMEGVHIFSENSSAVDTTIAGRGKNESTKYFLIPREFRQRIPLTSKTPVTCQKLETKTRLMFIYTIDKVGL